MPLFFMYIYAVNQQSIPTEPSFLAISRALRARCILSQGCIIHKPANIFSYNTTSVIFAYCMEDTGIELIEFINQL